MGKGRKRHSFFARKGEDRGGRRGGKLGDCLFLPHSKCRREGSKKGGEITDKPSLCSDTQGGKSPGGWGRRKGHQPYLLLVFFPPPSMHAEKRGKKKTRGGGKRVQFKSFLFPPLPRFTSSWRGKRSQGKEKKRGGGRGGGYKSARLSSCLGLN